MAEGGRGVWPAWINVSICSAISATVGASKIQRGRDLDLHDFVQTGENAYRQKGVATQCKEIIVDTDLFDLQHLCPDAGQHLLERRPWRDRTLAGGRRRSRDPV